MIIFTQNPLVQPNMETGLFIPSNSSIGQTMRTFYSWGYLVVRLVWQTISLKGPDVRWEDMDCLQGVFLKQPEPLVRKKEKRNKKKPKKSSSFSSPLPPLINKKLNSPETILPINAEIQRNVEKVIKLHVPTSYKNNSSHKESSSTKSSICLQKKETKRFFYVPTETAG